MNIPLIMSNSPKMTIDIWSDIMCPFCYIGKRNLETALKEFPEAKNLDIVWHSFQLDPTIESGTGENVYEYLAARKGMSYEQSVQMHERVIDTAKAAGLTYNFDKAIVANSFDAHRVIQLAKSKGLGDAIEERLFKAYFTEGKDFSNHNTLIELGTEIGLTASDIEAALNSDEYAYKVKQDIQEAQRIGVRGVPFFVFDRKYAVSGAQPSSVFLETLNVSLAEWQKQHPLTTLQNDTEGASCVPGGDC